MPRGEGLVDPDTELKLHDVLMASTAAPTFFPAHVIQDSSYVDGGLFANNPSLCAVSKILTHFPRQLTQQDLTVLSVGTGVTPQRLSGPADWGIIQWGIT